MTLTMTTYHENLLRDGPLSVLFIVKFFSSLETKMVPKIPNETFIRITQFNHQIKLHTILVWMSRWHESGEIHYMRINERASFQKKETDHYRFEGWSWAQLKAFQEKTIFPFFPSFSPYFSFLVITVFSFFFSFPMCLSLIFSVSLWTSRIISRKETRM